MEIDAALAAVAPESRAAAAAPVLVQIAAKRMALDEDELAGATRRGVLLAAAGGDPAGAIGLGTAAARETAEDLDELGVAAPLATALSALADEAARAGLSRIAEAASTLAADQPLAVEALAVVSLSDALAAE